MDSTCPRPSASCRLYRYRLKGKVQMRPTHRNSHSPRRYTRSSASILESSRYMMCIKLTKRIFKNNQRLVFFVFVCTVQTRLSLVKTSPLFGPLCNRIRLPSDFHFQRSETVEILETYKSSVFGFIDFICFSKSASVIHSFTSLQCRPSPLRVIGQLLKTLIKKSFHSSVIK